MNLYIYCRTDDLSEEQLTKLRQQYTDVKLVHEPDFSGIKADQSPKVVALNPDIVDWKFPNDLISQIPNLQAICLETTGYEWVDGKYCRENGITVTNVPHYAGQAVAEKSLFMALALAKKFPLFQREGKMNWGGGSLSARTLRARQSA